MFKRIVINVEENEIRVAILEDDRLVELHIEPSDERTLVGNIYKARVVDVVSGLQAAFVDIGQEKNAFLHFSDIPRNVLRRAEKQQKGLIGRILPKKKNEQKTEEKKPEKKGEGVGQIQAVLKPGTELLVQVKKAAMGTKPPRVTANIGLPGRYLVMLPYKKHGGGVSRKIRDTEERDRLRDIIKVPRAQLAGFIVRTAALQHKAEEINRDVSFLKKRWSSILRKSRSKSAPALLYNEQDILHRMVRDVFIEDIDEIVIDSAPESKRLRQVLKAMLPSLTDRIRVDTSSPNIFERYHIERQIHKALRRVVRLRSGGYLIFDELTALTAIDVNSGGFVGKKNVRETIVTTNLEATETIAMQIRLRDIGGLIVIDFIDMENAADRKRVWQKFFHLMKQDRATTVISQFTDFGLLQLTRKRTRHSLKEGIFEECPYCKGTGQVLNKAELWRKIKYEILDHLTAHSEERVSIEVSLNASLDNYIQKKFSGVLKSIQKKFKTSIKFLPDDLRHIEDFEVKSILHRKKK